MKKKWRRFTQKGLKLSNNKVFYGFFFGVLSLALVLNATFAWISFAQWRYNHMQGDERVLFPNIFVDGQLDTTILGPGKTTKREVVVTNTGKTSAFVRISLTEILATLEIDTDDRTGNANIKEYPNMTGSSPLKVNVPVTWQVGNRYSATNTAPYYQVAAVHSYEYKKSKAGRPAQLAPLTLTWGTVDPAVAPGSGYWLYQEQGGKGYYYYSDILASGQSTTILVDQTLVSKTAPNSLKGAFYRLDVKAEAGEATDGVYGVWGIPQTPGNPVYDRYHHVLSTS